MSADNVDVRALLSARKTKATANCAAHGLYETVQMRIAGRDVAGECPVCRELRFKGNLAALEHERAALAATAAAEARIKRLGSAAIPPRFAQRSFDNYLAENAEQQRVLRTCRAYAQRFESVRHNGKNLVLCGAPGTGKTHLACAIGNEIAQVGHTVLFRTVGQLVNRIRETWRRDSAETPEGVYTALSEVDLLIVDEVGVQSGTENEKTILFEIFNRRYESCAPSIVLSNLERAEFSRYVGERVMDRLSEGGAVLPFTWQSFRSRAAEFHKTA